MAHDYRKELQDLLEQLKSERDELNLQMHLAKAEAREQWESAEKKWQTFRQQSEKVLTEVDHTGGEIKEGLSLIADELKAGYRRIREQLR